MFRNEGYIVDVHPRTSRPIKGFYISQENDYFNAFDVMAFSDKDIVFAQVTDTKETDNEIIGITGGNVSKRMKKIDDNFPIKNPHIRVLVFLTQKRWVNTPGKRRHKEYFYRTWSREITRDGTSVWVERSGLSHAPSSAKE